MLNDFKSNIDVELYTNGFIETKSTVSSIKEILNLKLPTINNIENITLKINYKDTNKDNIFIFVFNSIIFFLSYFLPNSYKYILFVNLFTSLSNRESDLFFFDITKFTNSYNVKLSYLLYLVCAYINTYFIINYSEYAFIAFYLFNVYNLFTFSVKTINNLGFAILRISLILYAFISYYFSQQSSFLYSDQMYYLLYFSILRSNIMVLYYVSSDNFVIISLYSLYVFINIFLIYYNLPFIAIFIRSIVDIFEISKLIFT